MITILPLEAADVPVKARQETEAFATHPRMPMMWPRGVTPDYYAYLEDGYHKHLADPTSRSFKAVDTETGELVGSSHWTLAVDVDANAKEEPISADEKPPANWPQDGNWAMRQWYRNNLQRLLKQHFAGRPYIILNHLTVKPSYQQRGIGGQLLAWGIKESHERGAALCLESTPHGLPLYKKNGFKRIEDIDANMHDFGWTEPYDDTEAVRIFMIREPV